MFFKKYIYPLVLFSMTVSFAEKTAIWMTGLPCSGKTTLAEKYHELFPSAVILDGDVIRKTINSDLGFSKEDRAENLRRITEIGKMTLESVDTVLIACVSPYQSIRDAARASFEERGYRFLEVFVDASVEECSKRDVKGMYKKAFSGEIAHFTGVSDPYEAPANPDITLHTGKETIDESLNKLITLSGKTNPRKVHALFIGRWSPFHRGHWEIMNAVRKENPERPLLIMVRDREGEYWSANFRKGMVEAAMAAMGIEATVLIVPDIDSVNWGRDVGYTPRVVDVDARVHSISGTAIREGIRNETDDWKRFVCPGVAEYILEHSGE